MSVAESLEPVGFDESITEPFTEESYFAMGETPNRIELFDGSLVVSPAPSVRHQSISIRLAAALLPAVDAVGLEVVEAVNVRLRQGRIFIPDLVVLPDVDQGVYVPVELVAFVAEIVSPGNAGNDRLLKFQLYAMAGIPWYLLVESEGDDLVLTLFRLEDGAYVEHAVAKGDEVLRITDPFTVDLRPNSLLRR
ncbi:Uma2 family endonuclease [Longispora sp. K20-0274]|uniref:Uma2 family endonuclease n=1 Tax=Longispora sp. K20-0274 TaxID=3088255 RepID=UPI0039999884